MKRVLERFLLPLLSLAMCLSSVSAFAGTPTFSVAFSPTTVAPGTVSTMTYTIDNSANNVGVSSLTFSNTLPTGMTIADPSDISNTCINGSYTAASGSDSITFSDYRLGLGESCTLSMKVVSSTAGSHVNTTSTLSTSQGSVAAASATLTVDSSRPGFSMAFSPSTIVPGSTSTLTYTIDNTLNGANVNFLTFTHTLPTNLLVSADPSVNNTCTGGVLPAQLTATPNSGSISLLYGYVAAGSTCSISVNVSTSNAGVYITETGDLTQNNSNPSGSASSQLDVEPSFLFANFPASASPGSSVTLEFTINNLDRTYDATGITFTNDLNATLSGLTATALPATGFCGSGSTLTGSSTITVAGANLAAEASCSFEVTVLVPANAAAGTYTNTTSTVNLTLGSATTKPAVSNNLVVKKAPTITSQFIDDPVSASGDFTQRFVITNTDTANTASSISFTQLIDDQLAGTVVKTLPAANSCGSGSTFTAASNGTNMVLTVSGGNLAAGASCTFDVIMTAQAGVTPGSYAFTTSSPSAFVSGSTVYGVPASDTLVVVAAPALQVSINEDSTTPDSTVTTDFTLNYSANATADATGVGFTVDLPAALTGMTATPTSQSDICGSGSSFTDNGSSIFTLSGATLSPGDSCTFSITMQVPAGAAPGTVTLSSSSVTATTSGKSVSSEAASDTLIITGLTLSKTFVTDSVFAGDSTVLRYTITNAATALAATSMQFSDDLTSVISTMAATSLPSTPCGASSSITGTTTLAFSGGELQPGESCTFDVTVTLPVTATEGSYVSVSSVMTATVNSVNTSTNGASANLEVVTLSVLLSSTESSPTSLNPIPVTVYFSRPVVNFVISDLTVGNGSATNFSGSGDTYTVDIVPTADGTVTVDVAANVADDSVNGLVKNTAAAQLSREYTATPATVTPSLVISSPSVSATTTGPVTYTVTYSDAETVNLTDSAITLNNTGTNATVTVTNGDTSTATVTLSNISGDGTLGISIAANSARNGSELAPAAGPSTTFVVDNTQPSVTITDAFGGSVNAPFEATLTFNEDVTGFAIGDLSASNASLSGFNAVSASVYKVTVTPSSQGSVTLDVASSAAIDALGNSSTAAQHIVTYDTTSPSLSITGASTPYNAPFTATMTFNEDVTGFNVSDISVSNAALSNFSATSAAVYTVLVTPSAEGVVSLDVAANAALDAAGNGNTVASQYSVTYDSTAPTVVITGGAANANGVFTATFTFSEAVENFVISDITLGNSTVDNFVTTSSSVYMVDVTPAKEGVVTLDLANGVATDTAGNGNIAATQFSTTFDPVISLTASTNSVSETNGSVTLTASSNVAAGADITVNLVLSGTASNGTDYAVGATSLLIPANQSQATTTVTITSDTVVEGNETLIVDIASVSGGATNSATENGTQQQTVTIVDDDSVAVTLTASTSSVAEAAGSSTLTVTLDKTTFEDVVVNLGYSGTATSGGDYTTSASSLTIASGQTTGTVSLTATSDSTVEVAETIVVDITGVSGGLASESGNQQQTVTIIDDDSVAVTLTASASTIAEATGTSTLTATLDKATFEDVTVSLGYTGTATSGSDYTTSASITISAGQTTGSTTLTAVSDTMVEPDENIVVDITGVNGGSASESGSQQQTIIITDDDDSATVSLSVSNNTIAEAAGTSTLTATLDKATFEDVTVSLGYTGTASNGSDYTTSASFITIVAGQTTGSIILTAASDTSVETNETIIVDIAGVSGGSASESGTQQQTVTITDDDSALVTLTVSDSSIAEAAGTSTVTAVLDKATFEDVTVSLGYTGTASSGSDYEVPAGAITISAGQISGSTLLTSMADSLIETDETIIVDVTGVSGGSASESGAQQQTVTITDDDSVAVTLAVSSNSIAEAAGISTLTVTLGSSTFEDVVVSLGYTGTASSGSDYLTPSSTITIPAGQTEGTVSLTSISDTSVEADETIIADITGVSGGSAIERSPQQQTVTIVDDDSSVVVLTVDNSSIAETGGSSTLTATLDKATYEAVVVSLGYTGTATSGSDYVASTNSITIAAGQTTGTATLTATFDTLVEANETIIVDITGVSGGFASESNTQQQTVTINDDDSATVRLLVSNTSIVEAAGASTITAILDKSTFEDVVVSLGYSGTASSNDYVMSEETITVSAGQTIGTVTLTAVQDTTEETDESVIIDITGVSGGSVSEDGTQQQTVTISNDDNETGSDVATVDEGNSIQIDVLANDQGPGSTLNPASVNIYTAASNGSTSINTANGFITYTPKADFSGVDTFAYVVNDLQGNTSAPTTVTVTVNNINDAPVAVNDTAIIQEDNSLTLDVLANDVDVDGADDINRLTLAVVTQATHGQASVVDGSILYVPETNYNGSDLFSYRVEDNAGVESNIATVSINVTGSNDAPATQSDSAVTDEDTAVTIAVLDNDTDVDGQLEVNSVAMVAQAANGIAEAQTDGTIIYTPNDDFYGVDTFTYTVKDVEGAVSAATEVAVTVQGINDAPVAVDDVAIILEDNSFDINVVGNDIDVDDNLDVSSLVVVSLPTNGTVTFNNGMLNYTPAAEFGGNDAFSYTVSDLDGVTSNVATVTITVNPVNDMPLANDDVANTEEDTVISIDLLANDQDIDGTLDPANITLVQVNNGQVVIDTTTGVATYTPNADFNGVDTFLYRVNDNEGGESNTATVTIQISSVNDAPIISGTPLTTVLEGGEYRFVPDITNVDDDSLTITATNVPGWLTFDSITGELIGTPNVGDAGSYSDIELQVTDGEFTSALAAFSIVVVGDNDTDGIANTEDTDDDNDGMSDEFELANGFNPFDPADAEEDADNDGLSNREEALQSSNPLLDDQAPIFTLPVPLEFNATGLLTQLSDLEPPTAIDGLDGEVAVNLLGTSPPALAPGRNQVTWYATDAAGNRAEVQQQVDIHPLVSLSSGQVVGEGASGQIRVFLNGEAPDYPITISYILEGSADSNDHNLSAGSITLDEGELTKGIPFEITLDNVIEGTETLDVVLTGEGNIDAHNRHTLTIVENNVAPRVELAVTQSGVNRLIFEQGGGVVDFTATVNDPNPADQHTVEWVFSDDVSDDAVSDLQHQIDPAELLPGLYNLVLRVTDNGLPALTNEVSFSYRVVETLAVLSETQDSDGDGIVDADEGWADDDQDGQPNYLDAIDLPNVLNSSADDGFTFLLEADPDVTLVLGDRALSNDGRGAKLVTDELSEEMALPDDGFDNLSGYFDFIVNDLPEIGQSVNIVIAQQSSIPANAVYRKYDDVWFTFVEDADNSLMSAPGEEGFCPPPGDGSYRAGLNEGDWCVQLTIEDGGPNDADGVSNGSIHDPGGVGVAGKKVIRSSGSGGGSIDIPWMLLLLGLFGLYGVRRTRKP
ncbi:tandem-95 repeat protein [Litoribrevibacter albus]|nr:tandem-95 repeat protein [Litoribrevibacter albus]